MIGEVVWQPEELTAMRSLLTGKSLAIDPATTLRTIQKLKSLDCTFDDPMNPTRLIHSSIGCWADYLESPAAYDQAPPPRVQVYRKTASTQEVARRQAGRWFLAVADEQSAGRGRLGRQWSAPPGACVLISLSWPHTHSQQSMDASWYRVAVAVAETAEHFLQADRDQVRIKWPNDIVVDGKKLAGILIERAGQTTIIGIGFNVHLRESQLPDALRGRATSLALLNNPADRLAVIADLVDRCHRVLSDPDDQRVLDQWRRRSRLGYDARFLCQGQQITGTVLDLDADAGLIVRRETGELVTLPAATTSVVV